MKQDPHPTPNRKPPAAKKRLDVLLVERGLAPSRERAQAMVLTGKVRVDGRLVDKSGAQIASDAQIEFTGETLRYASRGGLKLEGALDDFGIDVSGRICVDVGSSTGGFTDCLLQRGASKVYAVDVTTNQLDWKLQRNPRVVMVERNARYLNAEDIPVAAAFICMDVSFISVSTVLPAVAPIAQPGADFLLLIKPQFELSKQEVGKGGIVREAKLHEKAIERVTAAARGMHLEVCGIRPSRITGAEGNQEFFLHARRPT